MRSEERWLLPKDKQAKLEKALADELPPLRAKLGISQGELAKAVGISRQTYSSIECKNRTMTWSTYLALIMFFDQNHGTHQMIRACGAFPEELVITYNQGKESPYSYKVAGLPESITSQLDDAAFEAVRSVIMLEYARCTRTSGEAVVSSFNGISFNRVESNTEATQALKAIKERRKKKNDNQP